VGSGPNGLAAAIVLAQAGYAVDVYEAQDSPGGAARTLPLTKPGFSHDFGSAVHPMAVASPFFKTLGLQEHGLEWIHSPIALAHPLDGGDSVCLHRSIDDMVDELGADAKGWRALIDPFLSQWDTIAPEILGPISLRTAHPFLMARFGIRALPSARRVAQWFFKGERAKALYAGLAAHSFLSLDEPLSASIGLVLGIVAHLEGWPIPKFGSQSITDSLIRTLEESGGQVICSHRVDRLQDLENYDIRVCDVTPRQLQRLAGSLLSESERDSLIQYRYGAGVFKVDYALSAPIPWSSPKCSLAATVHLGGTFNEIAASEQAVRNGIHSESPFVLLAQPSLFDSTRAPEGKHTAWAYCHLPHGSERNMLPILEAQIERFAPGFQDCIEARAVFQPSDLEAMDENLVGGDINGGVLDYRQFLFRPTSRIYGTTASDIFIGSSSTPPGGGVHGMCGYHAARFALKKVSARASR
jgi:phytoene dehydrogenase-like protein